MTDTIDLLEVIGQDAELRHASAEALAYALAQAKASETLAAAVAFGESLRLFEEFGSRQKESMHSTTRPAHEEEPTERPPPKPAVESPSGTTPLPVSPRRLMQGS